MATWNDTFNWCDSEEKLSDFFDDICRHVQWKLFENQDKWIYMVNELGKGRNPKIKSLKEFEDVFNDAFNEYTSMMRSTMFYGFLQMYADDDIDIDEETAHELNDWLGLSGEDAYIGRND